MKGSRDQRDLESRPLLFKPASTTTSFSDQVGAFTACRLGVDARAVVALQSVLALMVLFFVATFAFDKADWFNSGPSSLIDPSDPDFMVPKGSPWIKRLLFSRDDAFVTSVELAAAAALAICVLNRVQPRMCLLLLLFLMISLHGKSHYVQDCGGRLLRHMLFWACLLPTSVAPHNRSSGSKVISGVSAFGVQFQLLYLYWQVLSHRKYRTEWIGPDFSAVYYALSGDYALPAGLFLAQNFPGLCRLFTIGTMTVEALGPFTPLFIPLHSWWRAFPAIALMGLHAGVGITLNLWHFSILAMAINVIYLPTPFWDAVASIHLKADAQAECDNGKSRNLCWPCTLPVFREAVVAITLSYVVLHMEVFERQYRGTPLDDHNALYKETTLDELWIMYSGANTKLSYWDVRANVPDSHGEVDVLEWLRTGTWEASSAGKADYPKELPSCFSCLYPNMRWEFFLSKTADASKYVQRMRMRAMTRWLCARGSSGNALAHGTTVHFTNRRVYVNPPGSSQHFRDGGIAISETIPCEAQ